MTLLLGPFVVDPDQVVRLGSSFTVFVNRLLDIELAAARQAGTNLRTNYWENVPDEGVDAEVRDAPAANRWIPDGDSAWQFKRGDLGPQACRDEFREATWARDLVSAGANYRLVLGVALTPRKIASRRAALIAEARELGIPVTDDTFEVLDANALARWASEHPSLAVSRLLRGPGQLASDFDTWSSSNRHQSRWVSAPEREGVIASLRLALARNDIQDLRLDGVSGTGKSRLIMETIRAQPLEPLVTYVANAEDLNPELINHLLSQGRSAVVVVDECTGRRHEKLAEVIPAGSPLKLLTIGEPDSYAIRAPTFQLSDMSEEALDRILKENLPGLWAEARRFVTTQSAGNVRLALLLAERILREPTASANELIRERDISGLLERFLGSGTDFLGIAILALFRRLGWDGELSYQLEQAAESTGLQLEELRRAGRILERHGLLVRQGRYRSVVPHPVAVFLAARAWRELGDRLVQELLPQLDEDMAHSFFTRAADLGEFEITRSAIGRLLGGDGPFGSLDHIESTGTGKILTQIAIVAPDETAEHLSRLIRASTRDQLFGMQHSRRDLVWTLEKLAWHTRTFEDAADSLLLLADAENEDWANNATGVWVELFGSLLPGTAAKPAQRMDYLRRVATNSNPAIRKLVVRAASRALGPHETITVSGELQAGVLVEPRGTPATYGEVWEYQLAAIELLRGMLNDDNAEVVEEAESALIDAIHPMLQVPRVREGLTEALLQMGPAGLRKVRAEVEHLSALFERVEDVGRRVEGLQEIASRLPSLDAFEELMVLVQLRRWDFDDGELQARIEAAIRFVSVDERGLVFELLERDVPAAFELGRAMAVVWEPSDETLQVLVDRSAVNFPALVGYLWGVHDSGYDAAFDNFLEGSMASTLSPSIRVAIAVRGPATERGIARVLSELRTLSPAEGTSAMFGWHRSLSEVSAANLVTDWVSRIASQRDYNAVTDYVSMILRGKELGDLVKTPVLSLVMMRRQYPDVAKEKWDWARLAERFVPVYASKIAGLLFDVVESGVMIHEGDEDAKILERCMAADSLGVWSDLAERLVRRSWRLEIDLRGWLIHSVPPEVIESWIGTDLERARAVACIASVGGDEPTVVARLLLGQFGYDERVSSSLAGDLISGSWTGNESDRISGQIQQLEGWLVRRSEPEGVRVWARRMIRSLESARERALQREAEEDY